MGRCGCRGPKVVEYADGQREKLLTVELDVTDERQAEATRPSTRGRANIP